MGLDGSNTPLITINHRYPNRRLLLHWLITNPSRTILILPTHTRRTHLTSNQEGLPANLPPLPIIPPPIPLPTTLLVG